MNKHSCGRRLVLRLRAPFSLQEYSWLVNGANDGAAVLHLPVNPDLGSQCSHSSVNTE